MERRLFLNLLVTAGAGVAAKTYIDLGKQCSTFLPDPVFELVDAQLAAAAKEMSRRLSENLYGRPLTHEMIEAAYQKCVAPDIVPWADTYFVPVRVANSFALQAGLLSLAPAAPAPPSAGLTRDYITRREVS